MNHRSSSAMGIIGAAFLAAGGQLVSFAGYAAEAEHADEPGQRHVREGMPGRLRAIGEQGQRQQRDHARIAHGNPPGRVVEDRRGEIAEPHKIHVRRDPVPFKNAQLKNFKERDERKHRKQQHGRCDEEVGGEAVSEAVPVH